MYDLIILGGGPGGYKAGMLASKNGLKVAIVEKNKFGGTCLNLGCMPLKGLLRYSSLFDTKREISQLFSANIDIQGNISNLVEYNKKIISLLEKNIKMELSRLGVDIFNGVGKIENIADRYCSIKIDEQQIISSKDLIIATGSKPKKIDLPADLRYNINYTDDLIFTKVVPLKILILGGGVVGLEFAEFFNNMNCKTVIVEKASVLGTSLDEDFSQTIENNLKKKGIEVYLNNGIKSWEQDKVILETGETIENLSDVLISIGRTANIDDFGLEKTNIELKNGFIKIDGSCRTSVDNVYACGDVTGKKMLAHTAYKQAEIIINSILEKDQKSYDINYHTIPSVIFTNPQYASVGFTETYCRSNAIEYKVSKVSLAYSSLHFLYHYKNSSYCKLIYQGEKILGFQILGDNVDEIVSFMELCMIQNIPISALGDMVYPHPSVLEVFKEIMNNL